MVYLADNFNYLNNVNTSLQGKNENILTSTDKPSEFMNQHLLHIRSSNLPSKQRPLQRSV